VATIYLGWHFVVDDVAGLAIAVVSVVIGKRMIFPRGKSAAPEPREEDHSRVAGSARPSRSA
jgi:membrane-associated phospholipid phosphatase